MSFDLINYYFADGDIEVYPIGDVHLGSLECREKEWSYFCKAIQNQPNARVILLGDLLDMGITGSKTDVYSQKYTPFQQKNLMVEYLEPIKDRILTAVEGNHELRVYKQTSISPTYDICAKLGIENVYRQDAAFMALRFGSLDPKERQKEAGLKRPTYTLFCSHGFAKTRDEKLGIYLEGCDITITGHTHTPKTLPQARYKFDLRNNKVTLSPFSHMTVSSWLNWGGYGLRASYAPTLSCMNKIHFHSDFKKMDLITTI